MYGRRKRKYTRTFRKRYYPNKRRRFGRTYSRTINPRWKYVRSKKPITMIAPEMKYHDHTLALSGADTTGEPAYNVLNGIALGNTPNTRIGFKFAIQSLSMRMKLVSNANNTVNKYRVRIFVVCMREPGGSEPGMAEILKNYTDLNSPYDLEQIGRAWVMFDKVITMYKDSHTEYKPRYVKFNKRFKSPLVTKLRTEGTAYNNFEKNLLICYVMSDATATNGPTVSGNFRVKFTDC